jgi:hypothetical protein
MWIAGLPAVFRRSGQRGDPGDEAAWELLGAENGQDVAERSCAGVQHLIGLLPTPSPDWPDDIPDIS